MPGQPLILLHGYPLSGRMWDEQRIDLVDSCRLITPDLRGFGNNASAEAFTMESLADDVHSLLQAMGALPCILGGLSMGGYVALAFARKYASSLLGLILMDTNAGTDPPTGREHRDKMIELARTSGAKAIADTMIPRLLAAGTLANRPQIVTRVRQMIEQTPVATLINGQVAMGDRLDQSDLLTAISVPTLIIVGDADVITPPAIAREMHKSIGKSQLQIIRGAGHMAPMEQPAQVNAALSRFIKQIL